MDRKTIARLLDDAAARAERIDREPATGKQCWYLAGLMVGEHAWRAEEYLGADSMLTKRQASAMIETCLKPAEVAR